VPLEGSAASMSAEEQSAIILMLNQLKSHDALRPKRKRLDFVQSCVNPMKSVRMERFAVALRAVVLVVHSLQRSEQKKLSVGQSLDVLDLTNDSIEAAIEALTVFYNFDCKKTIINLHDYSSMIFRNNFNKCKFIKNEFNR